MREIDSILIIAGAKSAGKIFLRREAKSHDFVLALDGGADTALKAGILPDMALGDLDSISQEAKKELGPRRLFKISRQDNTDLEKGLSFCKVVKPKRITVTCMTGGRLDFTLSNFSSLFGAVENFNIEVKSPQWRIYPIESSRRFNAQKGAVVSLIPFSDIEALTLKGLKYGLNNAQLKVGQSAVSNIAKSKEFAVEFEKGKLLVMIYNL